MTVDQEMLDLLIALTGDSETIEQLGVLRLPWRLPDDPTRWDGPDRRQQRSIMPGLWTIDTVHVPWPADLDRDAMAIYGDEQTRALQDQANFSLRHDFTHNGIALQVQTDYCAGVDTNTSDPGNPPLPFETAIFRLDDSDTGSVYGRCWRYATRRAAVHGHQQIVAALS